MEIAELSRLYVAVTKRWRRNCPTPYDHEGMRVRALPCRRRRGVFRGAERRFWRRSLCWLLCSPPAWLQRRLIRTTTRVACWKLTHRALDSSYISAASAFVVSLIALASRSANALTLSGYCRSSVVYLEKGDPLLGAKWRTTTMHNGAFTTVIRHYKSQKTLQVKGESAKPSLPTPSSSLCYFGYCNLFHLSSYL